MLIIGDFNARISDKQVESADSNAEAETRKSEDKLLNGEGKKLLRIGEELGIEVRNGCTEGDWHGEVTYIGEQGGSVLDLVLERKRSGKSVIREVYVEKRTESDHLPITYKIIEKKERKGKRGKDDKRGRKKGGSIKMARKKNRRLPRSNREEGR